MSTWMKPVASPLKRADSFPAYGPVPASLSPESLDASLSASVWAASTGKRAGVGRDGGGAVDVDRAGGAHERSDRCQRGPDGDGRKKDQLHSRTVTHRR
jgi:hypothetical protein